MWFRALPVRLVRYLKYSVLCVSVFFVFIIAIILLLNPPLVTEVLDRRSLRYVLTHSIFVSYVFKFQWRWWMSILLLYIARWKPSEKLISFANKFFQFYFWMIDRYDWPWVKNRSSMYARIFPSDERSKSKTQRHTKWIIGISQFAWKYYNISKSI